MNQRIIFLFCLALTVGMTVAVSQTTSNSAEESKILALENAWGAQDGLERISRAVGVTLFDMNQMPIHNELERSIIDGSHVIGIGPNRRLADALGKLARTP